MTRTSKTRRTLQLLDELQPPPIDYARAQLEMIAVTGDPLRIVVNMNRINVIHDTVDIYLELSEARLSPTGRHLGPFHTFGMTSPIPPRTFPKKPFFPPETRAFDRWSHKGRPR